MRASAWSPFRAGTWRRIADVSVPARPRAVGRDAAVGGGSRRVSDHRAPTDGRGRPAEWVRVAEITASGFRLARVPPLLGRWIAEADEHVAAAPVVVIGYDVWQSRFASDRGHRPNGAARRDPPHRRRRDARGLRVPGEPPLLDPAPIGSLWLAEARARRRRIRQARARRLAGRRPGGADDSGRLPRGDAANDQRPYERRRAPPARRALYVCVYRRCRARELAWQQRIILLLVTLLLVPPCLNIAILIYARTVTRQEEFAARFALGASRGRIVVQLCVEVLVLSAAGAMALALTRPILTQIGEIIRRFPELGGSLLFWVDFDFSWRAALFVAGLSVLAALIAGLVPALQATGRVLPTALRSLGSRTGIPLGATWTALIVAQVALALAGLPSTMELAWGHLRPAVLGPGFAAREFLTARLAVDSQSVPAAEADLPAFASRVQPPGRGRSPDRSGARRIRSDVCRGIARRGASDVRRDGRWKGPPAADASGVTSERIRSTGPSSRYSTSRPWRAARSTAGISARRQRRSWTRRSCDRWSATTMPSAAGSGRFLPRIGGRPLVRDRRDRSRPSREHVPGTNVCSGAAWCAWTRQPNPSGPACRARSGPMSRRLQEIGTSLDPTLRLDDVRRLDEVHGETQMSSNLTSYALAIVTLSVLLLSAAGLYALMSFTVTRRRREIGIRTALGARPGECWRASSPARCGRSPPALPSASRPRSSFIAS